MRTESDHIAAAVASLGDRHASEEIRICEEVLKFEADLYRRRIAESRFIELTKRRTAA